MIRALGKQKTFGKNLATDVRDYYCRMLAVDFLYAFNFKQSNLHG
jgi:hypothetical protein